ncbi:MAG: c-type cytochrome [Acidobacteriota bacterium]
MKLVLRQVHQIDSPCFALLCLPSMVETGVVLDPIHHIHARKKRKLMKLPSFTRILSISLVILGGAVLLSLPVSAGPGFPPEKLENLKVFPKDIPTRQLIETMKKISQSLGVKCWFCHVGQEGMDISQFNFVSDEKPEKRTARIMMRMTQEINARFMAEVAQLAPANDDGDDGHTDDKDRGGHVTCMTCHRGKHHPEP